MSVSRRDVLKSAAAAALAIGAAGGFAADEFPAETPAPPADLHEYLLSLATDYEQRRRAEFAAVKSIDQLVALQRSLREKLLRAIGGLPERDMPAPNVKRTGVIDAGEYRIEKLLLESLPGYWVTALLYRPKKPLAPKAPGVISPCGHSETGKAADVYQTLHANLALRGYFVLTYDPVGQGERSQFWDAERGRSKFNLVCGEHAVLGNALYTVGGNLARYRIWDGIRALDFLSSLPEINTKRLMCVGNSGGGTLTAYLAALDRRISVAAICCYITTLPRRMATRIATDPDSDPEQDLLGFVSEGIDHAGLLALRAPDRPTLLGVAQQDFFPVEGTRETFAEAQQLFRLFGRGDWIEMVEAPEKHGLSLPIRQGVYRFFDRWLAGDAVKVAEVKEQATTIYSAKQLQVTSDGQVGLSLGSRPLLQIAWEDSRDRSRGESDNRDKNSGARRRGDSRDLMKSLQLDAKKLDSQLGGATFELIAKPVVHGATYIICVNGNESADWRRETEFTAKLATSGAAVAIFDPCGVASRRVKMFADRQDYAEALGGVEADLAYNAFLVGRSLLAMRVTDLLDRVAQLVADHKPAKIVLCGRRDAALVALVAAAVEPSVTHLAAEDMLLSYQSLFDPAGKIINAASIHPRLLSHFGDIGDAVRLIAPRKMLLAACADDRFASLPDDKSLQRVEKPWSTDASSLLKWLS